MIFHDIITEKKSPEVTEIAICNKKFGYLFFNLILELLNHGGKFDFLRERNIDLMAYN